MTNYKNIVANIIKKSGLLTQQSRFIKQLDIFINPSLQKFWI
jgi:hypothetical protein